MEKTTREYAEKLAIKMLKPNWGHLYDGDELFYEPAFFKKEKERIIEGYLKAVEETNVKELRDALEKLWKNNIEGRRQERAWIEAFNALNKTKS